jgi:FecR protein
MLISKRPAFLDSSVLVLVVALSNPAAVAADPPGRVARLGFVGGSATLRPAGVSEWSVATLNYPLTGGDSLSTEADSRAELQLGTLVVRLSAETALTLLNVDDRVTRLRLSQGSLSIRVHNLGPDDVVEIDTPNAEVTVLEMGLYRTDVNEMGDATVTVRQGAAHIETGASEFDLDERLSAVVTALTAQTARVTDAAPPDEWENWCESRDRRAAGVKAQLYVSRDLIGYDDLDEFGSWATDEVYGPIWVPDVRAEWAPYRFGRWAWIEPWGRTWIDDAPWGFATTHYGRWVTSHGTLAWVPGDNLAEPVYVPALLNEADRGEANAGR